MTEASGIIASHRLRLLPVNDADPGGVEWECSGGDVGRGWSSDVREAKRAFRQLHLDNLRTPLHRLAKRDALREILPYFYAAVADQLSEKERAALPATTSVFLGAAIGCACGAVVESDDVVRLMSEWNDHLDLNEVVVDTPEAS